MQQFNQVPIIYEVDDNMTSDMDNIVDALLAHESSEISKFDGSVLEYLVRSGDTARFKKICNSYDVDLNEKYTEGKTLLDIHRI